MKDDKMEKFSVEQFKNYLLIQDSRGDIMYNLSAENIRKANEKELPEGDERLYDEEIPDYGDLMTVEDWNQAVEDGVFIDSDGCGYWVKNNKMAREDEVFSTEQLDATHVMWFNK